MNRSSKVKSLLFRKNVDIVWPVCNDSAKPRDMTWGGTRRTGIVRVTLFRVIIEKYDNQADSISLKASVALCSEVLLQSKYIKERTMAPDRTALVGVAIIEMSNGEEIIKAISGICTCNDQISLLPT